MIRWLEAPLTDDERFKEARSYFPACYSNSFDQCITKKNSSTFPNCVRMMQLWEQGGKDSVNQKLDAEVQKMPYCSEETTTIEETTIEIAPLVIAGVAGLIGGFILARVI